MVVVKAGPGDTPDSLIRKFSRKVMAEGLLAEMKRREYYLKPALQRKEKQKEQQRNRRRRRQ